VPVPYSSRTVSDTQRGGIFKTRERRPHLLFTAVAALLLTARTSGKRCMLTTKLASKGDLWVDLRVAGAAVSPWLLSWSYFPIRRAAEGYRECGQEGILAASRTVPDNRLRWRAGVLAPSQRQMENLASEPIGHEVEAYRVKCVWYQFGDENGLKHGRVDRRPLAPPSKARSPAGPSSGSLQSSGGGSQLTGRPSTERPAFQRRPPVATTSTSRWHARGRIAR
jgi:hypothetical protein